MRGRKYNTLVSLLILAVILFSGYPLAPIKGTTGPSFVFTASGDLGNTDYTNSSLNNVLASGASFHLALGDLGYLSAWNPPVNSSYYGGNGEQLWCNIIKSRVGSSFPFELISGNHENLITDRDGFIGNYTTCLPDRINSLSYAAGYGKEYFFDYPNVNPLARIILISADLAISGNETYDYTLGSKSYNWLSNSIDGARHAGIPWVIVGMHEVCLSAGAMKCSMGPDLMNLLLSKRVDLILQAHDHEYQRFKQLTCDDSPTRTTDATYVPSCVANDGSSGVYSKGQGIVIVISGLSGGGEFGNINATDPEFPYLAKWMGSNNPNPFCSCVPGRGIVKFTVSASQMSSQFVASTKSGFTTQFTDNFDIVQNPSLQASFTYSPIYPTSGSAVGFSAAASGGQAPYKFIWNFGDGMTGTGNLTSHIFTTAGTYNASLTVTDSMNVINITAQKIIVSQAGAPTTLILRPDGRGNLTQWLPSSSCPSNWACISEQIPDGDLTFVRTNRTGSTDLYGLARFSTLVPSGSIVQSITVALVARISNTGQAHISPALKAANFNPVNGTSSFNLTTSYATFQEAWSSSPFTQLPWTVNEIDSLQIGETLTSISGTAVARVTTVWVQVLYLPPQDVAVLGGSGGNRPRVL